MIGMTIGLTSCAVHPQQDEDELSFEPDEVIFVVPFRSPDDEDDGWANGVREKTGHEGVFPLNFTAPM